jgi:hypothetical protein
MNSFHLTTRRLHTASLALISAVAATINPAHAEVPATDHITLSAGAALVDGNDAAFRARTGLKEDAIGGIESLQVSTAAGDWKLSLTGRALYDLEDYAAGVVMEKEDFARISIQYDTYRVWSDSYTVAGPNAATIALLPLGDSFALDRGTLVIEAVLKKPDIPQFSIKYTRSMRDGQKASTAWGDTTLSGANRSFVPSYNDIDETRETLEVAVAHTMGDTKVAGGVVMQNLEKNNRTVMIRSYAAAAQRFMVQREAGDNDVLTMHGKVETRINEQLLLTSSAMWTELDGSLSGDRIYGNTANPIYDPLLPSRQQRDHGVLDLLGYAKLKQFVGTVGAMYQPTEHLTFVPALRFERMYQDVFAGMTETEVLGGATRITEEHEGEVISEKDLSTIAASFDARYTGLKNLTLTASALYSRGEGNLDEQKLDTHVPAVPVTLLDRNTDYLLERMQFKAGVHWQAAKGVRIAAGAYHKFNRNEWDNIRDSTPNVGGDRFPAYLGKQDFKVNGANIRATWRITPGLMSITRVDYQLAKTFTKSVAGPEVRSGHSERQIISQSVNWQPLPRLSLQAGINFVEDSLSTPASVSTGTGANAGLLIVPADSQDYMAFNMHAFYAINDTTDLQLAYNGYNSDNSYNNWAVSVPLGNNVEEHSLITTLTKRFSDDLTLIVQYGLYSLRDVATANKRDFTAHVISSKVQYSF